MHVVYSVTLLIDNPKFNEPRTQKIKFFCIKDEHKDANLIHFPPIVKKALRPQFIYRERPKNDKTASVIAHNLFPIFVDMIDNKGTC